MITSIECKIEDIITLGIYTHMCKTLEKNRGTLRSKANPKALMHLDITPYLYTLITNILHAYA